MSFVVAFAQAGPEHPSSGQKVEAHNGEGRLARVPRQCVGGGVVATLTTSKATVTDEPTVDKTVAASHIRRGVGNDEGDDVGDLLPRGQFGYTPTRCAASNA